MNILAIDYGSKRVGLAVAVNGIIEPLAVVPNNKDLLTKIKEITVEYQVSKIYVGLSEGDFAKKILAFVKRLSAMILLPVETVEESVSTIEADQIYLKNKRKKKEYKQTIDSIAAAVILRRVLD
ncbi:MAG TPA: Holliday junction resolvase RuvX [Patescibacteria group bacterium]